MSPNSRAWMRAPSTDVTAPLRTTGTPIEMTQLPSAASFLTRDTTGLRVVTTSRTQSSLTTDGGAPKGASVATNTPPGGATSWTDSHCWSGAIRRLTS